MSSIKALAIAKATGGSGGGDVTVEALTATENKTYRAPSGKAYSPVTVNVPQSVGANIPVLLTVTTPPTKTSYELGDALDLTGIVVTATYADGTTENVTSNCMFSPADGATLSTAGDQTITATYTVTDTSTGHNYTLTLSATTTVTVTAPAVTIVPFASGTDEQVAAMIDAAQAGTIDLQQDGGWAVGDVRTISVSAFTGAGNTSHAAQNIDIVITSFDEYMSCGNVLQFDFKTCIKEYQKVNGTDTNVGGYALCDMKTTTLPALVEALPSWLKTRLIEFSVLAMSESGASPNIDTVSGNKLALRSANEVHGPGNYYATGDGAQLAYYQTGSNRIKQANGTNQPWWTRTLCMSNNISYIAITTSGSYTDYYPTSYYPYLAPFGCL